MQNRLIILFILFLGIIYYITLAPGLTPEDSGEIATAVYSLGIPHPPGYPLYIIMNKLFTFIPLKSIIFRTNLFSLFSAILCCIVLIKLIYRISSNFYIALTSALILGLSRTFWAQAIITEVYTFNLFIVSLFLLYSLEALNNIKYIRFIAFLTGLLIVSHYSNFLIIIPVWVILFLKHRRKIFKIRNILWGLMPLTLFFILLIRSKSEPLIDWGNPENFHNFIIHILRLSFGSMISRAPRNFYNFLQQSLMFLKMCATQIGLIPGLIVLAAALRGIIILPKTKKILFILLLTFTSLGTILVLNFKTDEESFYINRVFFLQFYLILIIVAASGFSSLKKSGILISCLLLLITGISNYKYNNRSADNFTLHYNRNLLKSAKLNSTIFVAKDFATFPLLYISRVEYIRPDIKFYDWFGNVFDDIFKRKDFHLLPAFKRDAIRERITDRIRVTNKNETYYAFQRATMDKTKCIGLIYTFNKKHPDFDINYYDFPEVPENQIKYLDYFVKNMISVYYFHLGYYFKQIGNENIAEVLFDISHKFGGNRGKHFVNLAVNAMKEKNFEQAIDYLKKAILEDPSLDRAYFYLGNIYFQKGNFTLAEKMYVESIRVNRLNGPAYNNLGNLYLKLGKQEKAKQIFKQGLFTGYSKLFNNLAIILIKEGILADAENYLKQGIEVSPEYVDLYLNLSVVLSRQNRWAEAKKWLERAIKIAPKNKNVILNLAIVYIKLKDFVHAKALLKEGAKNFPSDKRFKYYLDLLK